MKQLTDEEFAIVQEGAAAAHLLFQRLIPWAKQRYGALDGDTKKLLALTPEPIRAAFATVSQVSAIQDGTAPDFSARVPAPLDDIDVKTMRNELENVSAFNLPDITYEMTCVMGELPMYIETSREVQGNIEPVSRLLAWAWEGGRRYGMIESISVFDALAAEFMQQTAEVLERTRDRNLSLPATAMEEAPAKEQVN